MVHFQLRAVRVLNAPALLRMPKNPEVTHTTQLLQSGQKDCLANCGANRRRTQAVALVLKCGENTALQGESQA
jgi:hypothetical protein